MDNLEEDLAELLQVVVLEDDLDEPTAQPRLVLLQVHLKLLAAVAITQAGGVPPLIALVEGGTDGQKERAALALGNLARDDGNKVAIAQAGGLPPLIALVEGGTDDHKEMAARALGNLARDAGNRVAIAQAGGVPPLIAQAWGAIGPLG